MGAGRGAQLTLASRTAARGSARRPADKRHRPVSPQVPGNRTDRLLLRHLGFVARLGVPFPLTLRVRVLSTSTTSSCSVPEKGNAAGVLVLTAES